MKKNLIVLLSGLLMFTACQDNGEDIANPEAEKREVNFKTSTFDITKENLKATAKLSNSITSFKFFVLKDNKVVSSLTSSAVNEDGTENENFGSFSAILKDGDYYVLCYGTDSTDPDDMGVVHEFEKTMKENYFQQTNNADIFMYYGTLTVSEDNDSHSFTMNRIVSRVDFNFKDYNNVPSDIKKVYVSMKFKPRYYYVNNSFTSPTGGNVTGSLSLMIEKDSDGNIPSSIPMYVLAPETETNSDVMLRNYNNYNMVVKTRNIVVPIQRNCKYTASGYIFGGTNMDQGINISVNGNFDNTSEYNF